MSLDFYRATKFVMEPDRYKEQVCQWLHVSCRCVREDSKGEHGCTYIVQDDIVCRNAISRNEKQCLVVDLKDFADLARCDLLDVVLAEVNLGDSSGCRHVVRCDLNVFCVFLVSCCLALSGGGSCGLDWFGESLCSSREVGEFASPTGSPQTRSHASHLSVDI